MKFYRIVVMIAVLVFSSAVVQGQENKEEQKQGRESKKRFNDRFLWRVGFDYRFDNREFSGMEFGRSETVFGTRLTPEVGIGWGGRYQNNNIAYISGGPLPGSNRLMAGVEFMLNFGARRIVYKPIIYYNYDRYLDDRYFTMTAGIFPRNVMHGAYFGAFFSEKYLFYNNLLQGLYLRYGKGSPDSVTSSYAEAALDWHSMRSGSQREKFIVLSSGRLYLFELYDGEYGRWIERDGAGNDHFFYAGYNFTMHHYAASDEVSGVMDNLLFYPHLGYNWVSAGPMRASARAGWLQSFQRDRLGDNRFAMPGGFYGEASVKWRGFGIKESIYLGEDPMAFYDALDPAGMPYGNDLYFGNQFYRNSSGIYNRIELFWERYFNHNVKLKVSSAHHYDGARWGWQQIFTISADIF